MKKMKKMKVIFLDNDGVICLSNNWGTRKKKQRKHYGHKKRPINESLMPVDLRFDNFDEKSIRILNEIITTTDTEIVISSDWKRHATLDELQQYYIDQGFVKAPIDFTPRFEDLGIMVDSFGGKDLEIERSFEIKEWLRKHHEVTHWVSIDDLDMRDNLDNFVWCVSSSRGIKDKGLKEKTIDFLT